MPGVLVELGYISTPDEERYLLTEAGTDALAQSIYRAFIQYKEQNGSPIARRNEPPTVPKASSQAEKKPAVTPKKQTTKSDKPIFKIQILTSDKKLPANHKQFKGLSPVGHYQEKGIYKYTYGESTDYNKALRTKRQIETKFKGAFIIAFKNGKKIDVNQAIKEFKNNR